ncbi:MAG TPA: glycosyltransferase family 4 protein [Solirubrobacteraceae bacterium]|nr:glycosyltransferase family 4 protein [Solirubrobacteraceae bacterium]
MTGRVPAYRVGAFAALHEREGIEVALFGGRSLHGGAPAPGDLPFPSRAVSAPRIGALAAGGAHRAVICSTGGRAALPAAWAGARVGHHPLVLWASLWAHPASPAHALSYLPLRRLYRSADAVVTYGPHVSAYVSARGARNVHVAPQSVDGGFWGAAEVGPPGSHGWPADAHVRFLFAGRDDPAKGLDVLLEAWRSAPAGAALVLATAARERGVAAAPGAAAAPVWLGPLSPAQLREVYGGSDVLVVPSVATRTFREPWGLVVNEAMSRGLAVIASEDVGAAAGGLVRNGETGLVVPAGDAAALAAAIGALAGDRALRERLGEAGRAAVAAYTHEAWARGFSDALSTLGVSAALSNRRPRP